MKPYGYTEEEWAERNGANAVARLSHDQAATRLVCFVCRDPASVRFQGIAYCGLHAQAMIDPSEVVAPKDERRITITDVRIDY